MKKNTTERQQALVLLKQFEQHGKSNTVLSGAERVTPFVTALYYGVIERRLTLDHAIRRYSSVEFDKIDGDTLRLLRAGLYQLYYMREAPHAVVDEIVALSPYRAKGYINALLRSAIRDRELFLAALNSAKLADKSFTKDSVPELSVLYSFPQRLIKRWFEYFGADITADILKNAYNTTSVSVTLNPKYTYHELCDILEKDDITDITENANGNYSICTGGKKVTDLAAYKAAYFHVQDVSSYECATTVLKDLVHPFVYDVCSPPGGKSFTMAERGAVVTACAVTEKLAEVVRRGAVRLELDINVEINDGTMLNPKYVACPADAVLVDAPCSGFGTFRRKPEVKYKTDAEIAHLPQLQLSVLEMSSRYVKLGGRLVYSTCTLARPENEGVCEEFLARNARFRLTESCVVPPIGCDGFFRAVFLRI